ncbi:hypothetical protein KM043_016789 [Ampulex compressa]|nr:hypothetical protein KM043_016789 [Ampulex compressa]
MDRLFIEPNIPVARNHEKCYYFDITISTKIFSLGCDASSIFVFEIVVQIKVLHLMNHNKDVGHVLLKFRRV